jgi:hypothetical protein
VTDYFKDTGSSGTMMIRDTGTKVQFYLTAGSATFDHEMPWRFYYNGAWSSYRNFDFSGGAYRFLGEITVSTSQTVGFGIGATGTSGLGGPTTFTISVNRATVPPAPYLSSVTPTGPTTVAINANSNGNGGAAVVQWQVGWGSAGAGTPTSFKDLALADGTGTVTGLVKGTQYKFWTRHRNSEGWSAYSAAKTATTWAEPPAPTTPVISEMTQNSLKTVFSNNGNGGTSVLEWQLAYGLNGTTPESTIASNGTLTLTNLVAGEQYFFRARGRNSVGWGPWSGISTAYLKAGAYVKMGGVWQRAVPYVRVAGVWKIAQPYVKIAGLWKETA